MAELTEVQVVKIRDLYASGEYTQAELGERYGVTRAAISHITLGDVWAHAGGASRAWVGTRAKGEKVNTAKLDADRVREIRRLYAQGGHSYRSLSKQFGVTRGAIHQVVKHLTWKHI